MWVSITYGFQMLCYVKSSCCTSKNGFQLGKSTKDVNLYHAPTKWTILHLSTVIH